MSPVNDDKRWREWSKHVLMSIERLEDDGQDRDRKMEDMRISMAIMNTKIALWAAIGAFIAASIATITVQLILNYLKSP